MGRECNSPSAAAPQYSPVGEYRTLLKLYSLKIDTGQALVRYHNRELPSSALAQIRNSKRADDDFDVIAPAENLKKLFKLPFSKARVGIAVHKVGNTLVLDGLLDEEMVSFDVSFFVGNH